MGVLVDEGYGYPWKQQKILGSLVVKSAGVLLLFFLGEVAKKGIPLGTGALVHA